MVKHKLCDKLKDTQTNRSISAFNKFVMIVSSLGSGQGAVTARAKCCSGATGYLYRQQNFGGNLRLLEMNPYVIVSVLAVTISWTKGGGPDAI